MSSSSILRASPLIIIRLSTLSRFPRKIPSRFPCRRISVLSSSLSSSSSPHSPSICCYSSSSSIQFETLAPEIPTISKSSLQWVSRTVSCGELGLDDVGRRVTLCGWVALHRIHGGLTFLNLRDQSGIVQITTLPDEYPEAYLVANKLRVEYVVAVEGTVRARPSESVNKKLKTGAIEVAAEHVVVLNSVNRALPFQVTTADDVKNIITEEIRLRYRFLDLRRPQMQFNLRLRHQVVKLIRRYLEDIHDFVDID